jgi:branched-chain amino acid aminotransferase
MIVCINGKFVGKEDARISVFDHGLLYGDGAFETISAVNGKIFWMEEHVRRLLEGCKRLQIKAPWPEKELVSLARETFERNSMKDSRIRITVTRGEGGVHIYDSLSCRPNLIISCSPLRLPSEKYKLEGIRLKTVPYQRFLPEVKSLSFLPSVIAYLEASRERFDDALLTTNDGCVLEGQTFNVFMVNGKELKTPTSGILDGIVSRKVIGMASKLGFSTSKCNTGIEEFMSADEIFVTSTTRGVLPVSEINGKKIGNGNAGKVTKMLIRRFSELYY